MIGMVEQLLSSNASPVGHANEADIQQSASETTKKNTNFLSLLLQLFSGFVHPAHAAQRDGGSVESSEQKSNTASSNVLPRSDDTMSGVPFSRSGLVPDAATTFGVYASPADETFEIVEKTIPIQPRESTLEQSRSQPTTLSVTEKVITQPTKSGSALQPAIVRYDSFLEKDAAGREHLLYDISPVALRDAESARPESAMRNVEDQYVTRLDRSPYVGGAHTIEVRAADVQNDSPSRFLIDWRAVKISTQGFSLSAPSRDGETVAALKAVADKFADAKHRTERVSASNAAASKEQIVMDFDDEGNVLVVGPKREGKEEMASHPSEGRAETLPPIIVEKPEENQLQDRTAVHHQQKDRREEMQRIGGEHVGHRVQTSGEGSPNLFSLLPSADRSEVSSKSTTAGRVPPAAAMKLPEEFAKNFVAKIADEVRLHIAGKTSEVRVQLKPEHLGELSLRVTMQEGELTARLDVGVPAVKAALDAQLPHLREALAQQGIEIHRFEILADSSMQGQAQQGEQRSRHHGSPKQQGDVDVAETYAAMRDLGYNTIEYII